MDKARRRIWVSGLGVLMAAIVLPAPMSVLPAEAQLMSNAETRCRRALHSGAQRYYRTILAKQASCHRLRMKGKLSALRDCNDPDRLPSSLILNLIESHLRRRAQNACSGSPAARGYATCEAPCGNVTIRTFSDVGRCHACLARSEAFETSRALYGTPPVLAGNRAAFRCQTAIGEENVRYVTSFLTSHRRCQFLQDRGAIPSVVDCQRFDHFGMFERARIVLDRRIRRLCVTPLPAAVTGCAGVPGGLLNCITQQSESSADLIFRNVYLDRSVNGKLVFVTSQTYTAGEIGGVAGADAICQSVADGAEQPLRGSFRAWVSDETSSPVTRFARSTVPYFLSRGDIIAESFESLVENHPKVAIDVDENGRDVVFEAPVWTGTRGDGTPVDANVPATHCNGWSSDEGTGIVGLPYYIGGGVWSNSAATTCARRGHLYCFEQ